MSETNIFPSPASPELALSNIFEITPSAIESLVMTTIVAFTLNSGR